MEVLLVIVIIGIMTTIGVGLVTSQSSERQLQQQGHQWQQMLTYLCQQAVLNNQAYGVELSQKATQVLVFEPPQWQPLTQLTEALPNQELSWLVQLDGRDMPLANDFEALPHIVCYSDGRINPFSLKLWLTQLPEVTYEIASESPWQITGQWHE